MPGIRAAAQEHELAKRLRDAIGETPREQAGTTSLAVQNLKRALEGGEGDGAKALSAAMRVFDSDVEALRLANDAVVAVEFPQ